MIKVLVAADTPPLYQNLERQILQQGEFLVQSWSEVSAVKWQQQRDPFFLLQGVAELRVDLNYLYSFVTTQHKNAATFVFYQKNRGQKLLILDSEMSVMGEELRDCQEYHDGYVDSGIYFYNQYISEKVTAVPMAPYPSAADYKQRRPALFLDRDGIINRDLGYIYKKEQIEIFDEVVPIIQHANKLGWWVIVLTNQSGVGKGLYKEEDVNILHRQMQQMLSAKGAQITDWFYAPFLWEEGQGDLKKRSLLRKPGPAMVLQALARYPIDLPRSVMIGDKCSDVLPLFGLTSYLLQGNYDLSGADAPIFSSLQDIFYTFVK